MSEKIPNIHQESVLAERVLETNKNKETLENERFVDNALSLLAGDGQDSEYLRNEYLNELKEDVDKIRLANNQTIVSPDEEISLIKELLLTRAREVIDRAEKKWNIYNEDEERRKALLLLLGSGDFKVAKKYCGDEETKWNFRDIVHYAGLFQQSNKPFTYKEIEFLYNQGFEKELSDLDIIYHRDLYEELPDPLFQYILKKDGCSGGEIETILSSAKDGAYCNETFRLIACQGRSELVGQNLRCFSEVQALDILEAQLTSDRSPSDRDISWALELNDEELNKYISRHSFKQSDHNREYRSFELSMGQTNDYEKRLSIIKKTISEGNIGYLDNYIHYLRDLKNHDYEWLLEQVKKYDQEPMIFPLIKEKDEREFVAKLVDQDKLHLVSQSKKTLKNRYGQDLYEKINEKGYPQLDWSNYEKLDEGIFERDIKRTISHSTPKLAKNIQAFEFAEDTKFQQYKDFKYLTQVLKKEFGFEISSYSYDEALRNLDISLNRLERSSLDEIEQDIKKKAACIREFMSYRSSNQDAIQSFMEVFPPELLSNDFSSFEHLLKQIWLMPNGVLDYSEDLYLKSLERLAKLDNDKDKKDYVFNMEQVIKAIPDSSKCQGIILRLLEDKKDKEEYKQHIDFGFISAMPDYTDYYSRLEDKKAKDSLRALIPWSEPLARIKATKERPNNKQHDPWLNTLVPLLQKAYEKGYISLDSKLDGHFTADYVERFGMRPSLGLYEIFLNLRRLTNVDEISESLSNELLGLGIDAQKICKKNKTNIGLIINELEDVENKIIKEFYQGDERMAEKALQSNLILEIIDAAKGSSGFGHGGETKVALQTFLDASKENPTAFKLPEGYIEKEILVASRESTKVQGTSEEKKEKILKNSELQTVLKSYTKSLDSSSVPYRDSLELIKKDLAGFVLKSKEDALDSLRLEKLKNEPNEKIIIGLNKKVEKLELEMNIVIEVAKVLNNEQSSLTAQLEAIARVPDAWPMKRSLLIEVSLNDMKSKMPEAFNAFKAAVELGDDGMLVGACSEFLRNHVSEHYLNTKHNDNGPMLESTDKQLLKALKKAWGVQELQKNIVVVMDEKLKQYNAGEITDKKRSISLIPSKGMMRIFMGDLGNACTSQQNIKLAKGEFENTISYSLLIDKGKDTERFVGSFVIIEAETDDGEPAIVLRANNPQQALLGIVDADSLIEAIIEEVKELGKRRGISNVLIVRDKRGGASSNRSEVSNYYQEHYADRETVGLKSTPDTNFNNYEIWNKEGSFPVVKVN